MAAQRPTPEPRAAYRAFHLIPTRWMDNDAYAHLNNVVYYSFFDTAVALHLIRHGGLDPATSPVIGLVVETGCAYFAQAGFPDAIHAGLRVAHVGRSSARYEIGLFRNDDPTTAAKGHFVHVYVARETSQPVDIPPAIRAALEMLRTG
ncbi:MAG: acyl-CoA thioesterase [Rubrimonas sp.]|uniref:acyl-CoA thioesterase n=1 Tax=Rubrimonas sp. TaxID=2036015 RepID=UPI002FDD5BA1